MPARKKTKRGRTAKASAARGRARPSAKPAPRQFPDVEELVQLMESHGLSEVDYKTKADGTKHIRVSRGVPVAVGAPHGAAVHAAPPAPGHHAAPPASAPAAPAATAAPAAEAPAEREKLHAFTSPMVGTFYRAPSPEASSFVSIGDKVDPQTTVCIIEAMKVMNEIVPDVAGEIVSIEVENGEAVEFGQTLFLIRPA